MNSKKHFVGAALLAALFLAALPALALSPVAVPERPVLVAAGDAGETTQAPAGSGRSALVWLAVAALGVAGTVTQTYLYPGSGTVPATAAQARRVHVQIAQVNFADADTVATVTHNYATATTGAFPTTAKRCPEVTLTPEVAGTAFPGYGIEWTDGNSIRILKTNTTAGSGQTVVVYMRRPHSTGQ